MALKLGELLVKHGIVTQGQVSEGLRAQQMFGGRLGTNLVELGFLSEQVLAKFLSSQLSLPCIELKDIDNVPDAVIRLVPLATAEKHKVVPIHLDKRKLRVAMSDPTDLKVIDQISFSTGFSVLPVVSPELLITYALEKYYGIKRATRYFKLSGAPDVEFQVVQTSSHEDNAAKAGGSVKLEGRENYLQQERAEFKPPAFGMREALKALAAVTDHTEVFEILKRFAAAQFQQSAIFVTRGPAAAGWVHSGCTVPPDAFRKLSFGVQDSKLFSQLIASTVVCVTSMGGNKVDDWIAESIGLRERKEILAVPILVNSQPVSVMLASAPYEGELAPLRSAYEELAKKISFALQMTYLRKRILEGS
jgi:hypothetical protein